MQVKMEETSRIETSHSKPGTNFKQILIKNTMNSNPIPNQALSHTRFSVKFGESCMCCI